MNSRVDILNLVGKAYEAAGDSTAWGEFLSSFTKAGRGTMAALFWHDSKNQHYDVWAYHGVPDEYIKLYHQHYAGVDEWIKGGEGVLRAGWVGSSQSLCSDTNLQKTEFYSDFLRRFDLFHQCGGILQQTQNAHSAITLLRPQRKGPFGDSEILLLRSLMPHLRQATKLHQKFVDLHTRSHSLESAIELLNVGLVFVDSKCEVIFLNRKAEELLRRKDGLLLTGKNLGALVPRESSNLKVALAAAAQTGNGKGVGAGGTILVSRRKGRPLSVMIAPLKNDSVRFFQQPSAVLFITDPEESTELPADLLQRCYGLTPAEARLAAVLVEGCSLTEAAEVSGVTHNTAKSQLKNIFSKTGVRRQGELIRLLLTSFVPSPQR